MHLLHRYKRPKWQFCTSSGVLTGGREYSWQIKRCYFCGKAKIRFCG